MKSWDFRWKKRLKIPEFQREYKLSFASTSQSFFQIFVASRYALVTYQYNPPGSESGHELIDALSVGPTLEVDVLDAGIDLKT